MPFDKKVTSSGGDAGVTNLEIIDARDGEVSLGARLDRDIEKAKQVYVNVEGSNISTDSSSGYAKDVEILGNTIQSASNLADIRSVGDTVEGQELYEIPVVSCGKNLFNGKFFIGSLNTDGSFNTSVTDRVTTDFISVGNTKILTISNIDTSIGRICAYDKNKNFIRQISVSSSITIGDDVHYIRFHILNTTNVNMKLQLEEGTVATPYEPYVEDKLTILSPVQLEKVGDVADRIIEKDGVWGVEKNVYTVTSDYFLQDSKKQLWNLSKSKVPSWISKNIWNEISNMVMCNYYGEVATYNEVLVTEGIFIDHKGTNPNIIIGTNDTNINSLPSDLITKYQLTTPQFIPLPHDQQVKLRTFANKTNISFLTEIEGTIKAQVPKSLGATVNTHTEQIRSLNHELNRVKKLEENTVSTVTTESDFTTVEATSNGYFEDVKLEGRTLVNLVDGGNVEKNIGVSIDTLSRYNYLTPLKNNTLYTVILNIDAPNEDLTKLNVSLNGGDLGYINKCINGISCFTLTTDETPHNEIWVYFTNGSTIVGTPKVSNVIVLEGDHTQNPPSYFEGLKSVGQSATTSEEGVDEVSIESVKGDGNLFEILEDVQSNSKGLDIKFDKAKQEIKVNGTCTDDLYFYAKSPNIDRFDIKAKNSVCSLSIDICEGTATIGDSNEIMHISIPSNLTGKAINLRVSDKFAKIENVSLGSDFTKSWIRFKKNARFNNCTIRIMLNKDTTSKPYTPHQSDKKRLLYYNNETQAWEKPILREWDSIEKHANGKYYYHQRSAEVVLNGREEWTLNTKVENYTRAYVPLKTAIAGFDQSKIPPIISDKFKVVEFNIMTSTEVEGISLNTSPNLYIKINDLKLSTQDVQGFKQWLQANNVTVVYQLAQEKVYECTNIDLITYANETNYVVESGAIVPKTTLKVMSNISNTVRELQRKVSTLESYIQYVMIDALKNALNE